MSQQVPAVGWRRLGADPVIGTDEAYDANGVADPHALVLEGTVWVLYEAIDDAGKTTVAAASSDDGRHFEKYDGNPVFDVYGHHSYPALVRVGEEVYMTPEHLSNEVSVWRTGVDEFPGGWTHVRDIEFNAQVADPSPFSFRGDLYLVVGVRLEDDDNRYHNKLLAIDDLETGRPREVCDIYPADPASSVVSERSAFTVALEDRVLLFHQADEELAPDGLCNGGTRGDRVHVLELRDLSPTGVTVERSTANPVVAPRDDGWESGQVHSLSVVRFDGEWLGYYDGHDGDRWRGVGVGSLRLPSTGVGRAPVQRRPGRASSPRRSDVPEARGRLYDDFADGDLHVRDPAVPRGDGGGDRFDLFRPVWTVGAGSPDATGPGVTFGPDTYHEIHRYSDVRLGRWSVDLRFGARPTSGHVSVYPLSSRLPGNPILDRLSPGTRQKVLEAIGGIPWLDLGVRFYRARIDASGELSFQRRRDGRTSTLLAREVGLEPGHHELALTRGQPGSWTVSWDGRRIGTVDDVDAEDFCATRVGVDCDETVTLTRVRVD